MMNVGQLRKALEGMDSNDQVLVESDGWLLAIAFGHPTVLTGQGEDTCEQLGERKPGDIDAFLMGVIE